MEEIIISPTIEALIESLKSAAAEEIKFAWGIDKELTRLLKSFSSIQHVLADAEGKQLTSRSVKKWLLKLKNVAYDAEDIIEEFITRAVETKMEDEDESTKIEEVEKEKGAGAESRNEKQVMNRCSCFHSENAIHEIRYKLRSLRKRVKRIEKDCRRLRLTEAHEQVLIQTSIHERLKISLMVDALILGREEDKNKLVEELLSDKFSVKGPSVIPIIAPDGIGKTTLARLVYNCKEAEQRFKHRWWFRASPDLNEEKVIKEIFMSTLELIYDGTVDAKLLFKDLVRKSRFLLVLDNVRDDNPNWKILLKPFTTRHNQSKIIITTPSEEIGSVLGTAPPYRLEGLSHENCSKLFYVKAFDADSFRRYPNLRETGGKIVEKCGGFPLAVKALGGLLWNERNENEWGNVLESSTWNKTEDNNGVLPALKICYQKLPAKSKMCFRYCSLFPRDYYFKENELVELWIGEEYIQDQEGRQIDKATQIFYDLLIKSFLSVDSFWTDRPRFKMHDLAHNLAEAVTNEEFIRLEEGKPSVIPKGARHSSFVCFNEKPLVKLEELCKYKRLRSFLYIDMFHNKRRVWVDVRGIFPTEQLDLLLQCKLMRVLRLQGINSETLPESFSSLKLLRFLDLSDTTLRQLPNSICKFYNLETLDLRDCILMNELPKDIKNVINLRFLYLEESMHSIPLFPHVGNLRKLQTLPSFGVRRETGYMISEMKEMSDLKGGIIIFNLQNVVSGEEAQQAKMKNKPYITDLTLEWYPMSGDRDSSVDEEVLYSLEPHSSLKKLTLVGYQGKHLPSWLQNLTDLKGLELHFCPKLSSLPENGLPSPLQLLKIISCSLLKERCKQETGEDWPKIAHIPEVTID